MTGRNDERLRCSFCGKTQDQVRKLIADQTEPISVMSV